MQFSVVFFYFADRESRAPRTVPFARPAPPPALRRKLEAEAAAKVEAEKEKKMAEEVPAPIVLDAPKSTPFTTEELKKFNGSVEGNPIYVAIKGQIFDGASCDPTDEERALTVELPNAVSAKRDMYGPGAGYNVRLSAFFYRTHARMGAEPSAGTGLRRQGRLARSRQVVAQARGRRRGLLDARPV